MRIRSLVVAGLLVASPAYAVDHLMHVDEVVLDGGGGEQYIELHDTFTESLPNGPYNLVIFDGSGAVTEEVTLTGLTAGSTVYYVAGNAAAAATYSSITFGATITMALPNPGQACFARANDSKIHCVAWGCPATPVTNPSPESAMAPPSGMSLSRPVAGGPIQFATITPGAANSAGTNATACATPTVDAGVTPDAPGNNNNPDAGTDPGGGDDDSGCCQSSSPTRAAGSGLLSLFVLGLIVRRRRRA